VLSAGGAYYFILIMDSIFLFWSIEFLRVKTVEVTLEVLKSFMVEIEHLIGQKLKRMRVD